MPDEKAKHVTRIIDCYFAAVRELRIEEWNDPNASSVILTNNGFAVFFMLFSDIIRHFDYYDQKSLFLPANRLKLIAEMRTLLEPGILLLSEPKQGETIVKGTARGLHMDNARKIAGCINEFYKKFIPPRLDVPVSGETEKSPLPKGVLQIAASFELKLRQFVLKKLVEWYGKDWWKQGIPGDVKVDCDKGWEKNVREEPKLQNRPDANEYKFSLCDITRITKVIRYNWKRENDGFVNTFLFDENEIERRINEVKAARDPEQHKRESTTQVEVQAASRLRWFSQVLEDKALNPFTA